MERWVLYATLSMLFAGFTSVIAKMGMEGISAELGLSVRTLFVCGFVTTDRKSYFSFFYHMENECK